MKISGFTIVRNALINDYPIVESILSLLPVVDEMLVSIGDCSDDTEKLVRSIDSTKIRIVHSVWDPSLRKDGAVLAVETDKALSQISRDCDWAFYLQADEVLAEYQREQIKLWAWYFLSDRETEAFIFPFVHFYGSYDYVANSRKWYSKEVRLIRPRMGIQAYRDAQGFRREGEKLHVREMPVPIYHYGWVKTPFKMKEKLKHTHQFWRDSDTAAQTARVEQGEQYDFSSFDSLAPFRGRHPSVMDARIAAFGHPTVLDINQRHFSFKGRILFWIERTTGLRLFTYRNYRRCRSKPRQVSGSMASGTGPAII